MEPAAKLDTLRAQHKHIVEYERARETRRGPRNARDLPPHIQAARQHIAQWDTAAAAADSSEASPLLPLFREWCGTLNVPAEPAAEPAAKPRATRRARKPAKAASKAKAAAKPAAKKRPAKAGAAQSSAVPAPDTPAAEGDEAGSDDGGDKLLGPGNWLDSHAKIVRQEIPKVKAKAADPKKYEAAKRDFLKRFSPQVTAYIKAPKKGHSPLFAYCVLFLSDTGQTGKALALAEKAVELQQTSPIKRNYHELLFDVRLAELERQALSVAKAGKAGKGKPFSDLSALRDRLMGDPFRGNHAKAKVCKTFAEACMALGDYAAAQSNLQQVKFLDPNMGVETLLGTCEDKLAG